MFTHRDVDALRITTDRGELVTTAAHPLYAQGRGFVPAGRARTAHNIEVDTTTGTWTLAHNGCTWDDAAGEWIDTETGKPRTPTRFSELVNKGRINYDDVNRLATQNGLTNQWAPPTNPNRFVDGGFKYDLGGEIAWGHGPDIIAKPHQYAHNNPTMSINRPAAPNTLGRVKPDFYHTDETWSPGAPSTRHLPLDNSPYKQEEGAFCAGLP